MKHNDHRKRLEAAFKAAGHGPPPENLMQELLEAMDYEAKIDIMLEGIDDIDIMLEGIDDYARLAKSDPMSAAVYFHRATGKHLFEVENPCLL